MKVAVVGGGWAGMAAAHALHQGGHDVTVFEVAHQLGGRARGITDEALGSIDNGQHLLIGAYQHTLSLIDWASRQQTSRHPTGHQESPRYVRMPLSLRCADDAIALVMGAGQPLALTRLKALCQAKGLSKLDRVRALWLLGCLQVGLAWPPEDKTVLRWLTDYRQSANLLDKLWIPLCLATMNTPPEVASAAMFARVLKDSLLSATRGSTDLIIPCSDLTGLWIEEVARQVEVMQGKQIIEVTPVNAQMQARTSGQHITEQLLIADRWFDGCVIAVPPASLKKIVDRWNHPVASEMTQWLDAFEFLPITTCYVEMAGPFALPEPMLMLRSGHPPRHPVSQDPDRDALTCLGQWVFDRNAAWSGDQADTPNGRLAFVISHASQVRLDRKNLAEKLIDQLHNELLRSNSKHKRQLAADLPDILASQVITEKRATFAATPLLTRPSCDATPYPNIKLAGDWTDTGYPAVLEGAVISGFKAAESLMRVIARSS